MALMCVAMTPPLPSSLGMAELLADAQWVRALARTLAADADDADDLTQEAYLQALRRPPGHAQNVRGWFQRVLQNLVRQRRRATRRRLARERGIEVAEAAATDDLVGRATAHRAVVDAVLCLDEPYRGTILLRFFEDLPPREIAARMGVPVATVHTRIQRGCARLRTRLDRGFGDRRAWCAALLPLPQVAATLTSFELLLMNGKAIALGTTLVVGASALWFGPGWLSPPATPLEPDAPAVALQGPPVHRAATAADGRDAAAATRTAVANAPAPVAASPTSTSRRLEGRVVDGDGRPVPNVQVVLRADRGAISADAPRARCDRLGSFALVADRAGEGSIVTDEADWVTVMFASVRAGQPPRLSLVVAAPKLALAGHVRSAAGRAVAGASLQVVWPADLRARLSDISDAATEHVLRARTDVDAAFALEAARVRGAELVTTAEGFLPDRRPLPEFADGALEIILGVPEAKPGMLQGQVVDPRGAPVSGARVALGEALERSDEQGRFVIADDGKSPLLSAAMLGHRRAALARPEGGYPGFVTLALGAEPLAIRGRVVDAEGKGLPRIKVWAIDPTLLSDAGELFVAEGVAAGCTTMGALIEQYRRGELADPERTLRETPTAAWPWVSTGADGAFTLTGLEDRAYRLRAMDDKTALMVDADPVPAGSTEVVIRLRQDALFGSLRGRVVARNGEPVAGARVHVQVDTQRVGGSTMHGRALATATSDAEGRFELHDVPKDHAYLRLEGEGILPLEYGRGTAGGLLVLTNGDVRDVRIEVCVRMHVQVELRDPTSADALAVHDLDGASIVINVFSGRSRRESDTLEFVDGKTPVFVVPDTASALVLLKGGKEVRREPLQLLAGAVNALRY